MFIYFLSFDINSYRDQLLTSIIHSRDFALKNFLRVRAVGKPNESNPLCGPNTSVLSGSIKFEAVVPDFVVHCVAINLISIEKTPLSVSLLTPNAINNSPFGYLTLNQVRRVIFLQENDPSITTTPTVGCWIRFESNIQPPHDTIYHPNTWLACLKFVVNDSLVKTHVLNNQTFLLVRKQLSVDFSFSFFVF
jgi:hypothetical protein